MTKTRAYTETKTSTLKNALDPHLILLTFLKVGTRLAGPVLTRLLVSDRDGMILQRRVQNFDLYIIIRLSWCSILLSVPFDQQSRYNIHILSKGSFHLRFSGFCPLRKKTFFFHTDFPSRGGGYPPIPLRKKSAKTAIFGRKTPILALFDPFFE